MLDDLFIVPQWPYLPALERLALALALGFFVGLERQRRGKEAGVRTFAFAALTGALGGLLGDSFALAALALIGLLVIFLTVHAIRANHGTELTTSAALIVIGFTGVLCGKGHTFTPTAVAVLAAALLTYKESISGLSLGLTETELRSAIMLAILAGVIYPALPAGALDPWGLVEPRAAWLTVLLIASLGFGNYILLKLYGGRAVELTGFFGGLVNSTVTVTALSARVRENPGLAAAVYRGVLLATAAMLVRNALVLAVLAPTTLASAGPALGLMLAATMGFVLLGGRPRSLSSNATILPLQSPFRLRSALQFGLLFLALKVAGTLAQRWLGPFGFYAVSLAGGLVSSASAVAAAGSLAASAAEDKKLAAVAGTGAVIASLASTLVDLPLVAQVARERPLTRRTAVALGLIVFIGAAAAAAGSLMPLADWWPW